MSCGAPHWLSLEIKPPLKDPPSQSPCSSFVENVIRKTSYTYKLPSNTMSSPRQGWGIVIVPNGIWLKINYVRTFIFCFSSYHTQAKFSYSCFAVWIIASSFHDESSHSKDWHILDSDPHLNLSLLIRWLTVHLKSIGLWRGVDESALSLYLLFSLIFVSNYSFSRLIFSSLGSINT